MDPIDEMKWATDFSGDIDPINDIDPMDDPRLLETQFYMVDKSDKKNTNGF